MFASNIMPFLYSGEEGETGGKSIKHPNMAKHHVMHHVFDAVSIEGFIQKQRDSRDGLDV